MFVSVCLSVLLFGLQSSSISKLLNDPTVLRQLHELQKLKQQEDKQSKLMEMRKQEEAFEQHLTTVIKVQFSR